MKTIDNLNRDDMNNIFAVLMDSSLQKDLMRENHPDAWMLDYVYDSQLRQKLEELDIALERKESLEEKLKVKNSSEDKTKI